MERVDAVAVNMRDVAARAGVSVRTVSNVVNDYHYVKDSTRARVQAALDELGYQVNAAARSLKSGRTGLIALVVPELHSPYFAELSDAVVRTAAKRGLTVLIEVTEADYDRELRVLTGRRNHLTDGTLFSPVVLPRDSSTQQRSPFPLVVLGESPLGEAFDHVGIDNTAATQAVVRHLLESGRTRVAAIGANPDLPAAGIRLEGFERTLADAGLRPHSILPTATWDRSVGSAAIETMLTSGVVRPDAIFAFNDTLALGALSALRRHGVDVPGTIAVAGFDDVDEARYASPPLTTIAPDLDTLAEAALDRLVEQIDTARTTAPASTPTIVPRRTSTPFRLVVRSSTVAGSDT